ncbi:cellulose binding domain-containing protein [Nonomuraea phyllanthi]|uniref:cellulose binding domain-containing protein n=1 Tax=Nonomuraea phyllanthi TaxID=2219224 RepID=UPI001884FA02
MSCVDTATPAARSGWTVRWTLASGQAISRLWNGTLSTSGTAVSVRKFSYNGCGRPCLNHVRRHGVGRRRRPR